MPELFTTAEQPTHHTPTQSLPPVQEFHMHGLASFCQHPLQVSFQTQEADEVILLLLRKHLITNLPWIFTTIILIALPFLFTLLLAITNISLSFFSPQFSLLLLAFYYLMVFAYAFINFITWFYNIFLVTTKRVVDIDFSDIIFHNMAITKIELIEDIDYSQTGFIRSFFNYGDVFIQTAGDKANFEALAVPKPGKIIKIVGDLIGRKPNV